MMRLIIISMAGDSNARMHSSEMKLNEKKREEVTNRSTPIDRHVVNC